MLFESSICVQRDGKAKGKPKEVDNTLYSCGGGECHHGLGHASLTLTSMTIVRERKLLKMECELCQVYHLNLFHCEDQWSVMMKQRMWLYVQR